MTADCRTWQAGILACCDRTDGFTFRRLRLGAGSALRPRLLASAHCASRTRPVAARAAQLVRHQSADAVRRTPCPRSKDCMRKRSLRWRALTDGSTNASACPVRALQGHPLPSEPSSSLNHGCSSSPLPMPEREHVPGADGHARLSRAHRMW